jgi:cytochrome c5
MGQDTYEQFCSVCHRDGLAGAPKFRSDEWDARAKQKTVDELVESVINGLNAMPPKGTCSECSDEDLKDALLYMLPTHHD